METNNLKFLQENEDDKEPDNLKIIWDSILLEYESLTKRSDYSIGLRRLGIDLQKHSRLTGLIACYHLLRYGREIKEDLAYWGVTDNIKVLEQKILQERTRLNIEAIQKAKPQPKEDFDKILVLVENALNRNLDDDNLSVKKWVYLCKSIEERANKLEHGRQNNRK